MSTPREFRSSDRILLRDGRAEVRSPLDGSRSEIGLSSLSAAAAGPGAAPADGGQGDIWSRLDWFHPLHLYCECRRAEFVDTGPASQEEKSRVISEYLEEDHPPAFFKVYPGAEKFRLPDAPVGKAPLYAAMLGRRTSRAFSGEAVSLAELSVLLKEGCAEMLSVRESSMEVMKSDPAALTRSLFTPFEVYIVAINVDGLEKGVYHYNPRDHMIERLRSGDFSDEILDVSRRQFVDRSSAVLVFTSVFERYMWRYRHPRAYMNMLMTLGRLAQVFILSATGLGLKNFLTPALKETECDHLLGIDGWSEGSLYMVAVGR
jgi:SagB-type dehydrogenase family enzyme